MMTLLAMPNEPYSLICLPPFPYQRFADMGNISSDLQTPGDANLLLLLVRYWSSLIDAADNISITSKSRKLMRTPSLTSIDSKRSSKLKRSRPVTVRKTQVIQEEFDWQQSTKDELQALKGGIPWKELGWGTVRSPKMRRRFRKRRKKANSTVSNEMWTLSEPTYNNVNDEKIFWKPTTPILNTGNRMLWRAFKDANSENDKIFPNNDYYSEIFQVKTIGNIETMGRKQRLSRWNFLRQPTARETSFRKRKPTIRRTVASSNGLIRKPSIRKGIRHSNITSQKILKHSWIDSMHDIDEREEQEDCSCCSCEKCINREKRIEAMAPNSEDSVVGGWRNELSSKEPQRPPVYNPEDYALSLKKWGRKNNGMNVPLGISQSTASLDSVGSSVQTSKKLPLSTKSSVSSNGKGKENFQRPPVMLQPTTSGEMSLRQFSSVTELLTKLKTDLQLSFPSFVQEFVGDPVDGVTLLLELLRAVQLSQSQQQRCPPQIQRRALLDEHSCLICLQHCLRCTDASRRLSASPAGLFTLAVCIMSNVTKSRVLALELLTKACDPPGNGHAAVADALSTLRLRFGEPVRFRFLVGMLNSAGAVELLTAGMRFINAFLETSPTVQQRVYIQAELEQAGFSAETLRKTLPSHSESVKTEINRYEKNFIDVSLLQKQAQEVISLRDKLQLLEKRIKILQEEKGVLRSLEQCLKERCSELEEEVSTKTSTTLLTARIKPYTDKGESTPAEDEGISSSELSQDEEPRRVLPLVEPKKPPRKAPLEEPKMKPPRNLPPEPKASEKKQIETEDEATIEEVIEELQNIVKEVDTKPYKNTNTWTKKVEKIENEETEIIPAIILPQPPRRAKSLVHIFFSGRECDDGKFFDEGTESGESDDSGKHSPLRMAGSLNDLDPPRVEDKVQQWREKSQESQTAYQERNIDEETIKRRNMLQNQTENKNQSPFVRRTQRFVPIPVKRSQTFHSPETQKMTEVKPKPKMGVSGLDMKRDYGKYQNVESRNRYNKKNKEKTDQQRRGSLDELQHTGSSSGKSRSISLERVDSDELKRNNSRNIGPRTRRSLADSSLFTPPQPKQRTSLARQHSGSSTPLTLPIEILPRAPPDGSSSPLDYESSSRKTSKSDESPIYATPNKPSKLQKFFGNPRFENSAGEANQKYFESNYACLSGQPAAPRNVVKALLQPHPQKPNFYLGTYQMRPVPPAPTSNSSSGSPFAPPFLMKRSAAAGMYSGSRENLCSPTPTEISMGSRATTARLSDSLSGLY